VPYGYRDSGWFDYQPMAPMYPTAVWNITMAAQDWQRVEQLRRADRYDWRKVLSSIPRRMRPRGPLAALPGRGESHLPRGDPGRQLSGRSVGGWSKCARTTRYHPCARALVATASIPSPPRH